ncbi:MAG: hypothetical protein IPK63_18675 [Candidatus Competibacteraceae bacterium]|nr:hypothetical protein [Candidatus Competibacteraceae bacterium]
MNQQEQQEKIVDFLRRNPNCSRRKIEEKCGLTNERVRYSIYRLLGFGVIGKSRVANNDYRYFVINDALLNRKKTLTSSEKAAIRSAANFEKFRLDVTQMIKVMPGRSTAFYAGMIGIPIQRAGHNLMKMKALGLIVSGRRFRKDTRNYTRIWWIKGSEPAESNSIEGYEEDAYFRKVKREAIKTGDDDDAWLREARKPRQQRIMERLQAQNKPLPIPSYDDCLKTRTG